VRLSLSSSGAFRTDLIASYIEGQGANVVEKAASSTLAIFENIVLMVRDIFNDDIMLRQLEFEYTGCGIEEQTCDGVTKRSKITDS